MSGKDHPDSHPPDESRLPDADWGDDEFAELLERIGNQVRIVHAQVARDALDAGLKTKYPRATIDRGVDATYVHLRKFDPDTEPPLRTVDLSEHLAGTGLMIHVDIDADGKAIGVEIL